MCSSGLFPCVLIGFQYLGGYPRVSQVGGTSQTRMATGPRNDAGTVRMCTSVMCVMRITGIKKYLDWNLRDWGVSGNETANENTFVNVTMLTRVKGGPFLQSRLPIKTALITEEK